MIASKPTKHRILGAIVLLTLSATILASCGAGVPSRTKGATVPTSSRVVTAREDTTCRRYYTSWVGSSGTIAGQLATVSAVRDGDVPGGYFVRVYAVRKITAYAPGPGTKASLRAGSIVGVFGCYVIPGSHSVEAAWGYTNGLIRQFGLPALGHVTVEGWLSEVGGPIVIVRVGPGVSSIRASFFDEPVVTTSVVDGVAFVTLFTKKLNPVDAKIEALSTAGVVLSSTKVTF